MWRRTEVSIPTAFLLPTVFWTGVSAGRRHPAIGGSSPVRTGDHGFAIRRLNQLGHGTEWYRTEVSILVLLGQSQVCSHYTSPVCGARGEI